MSASAGLKAEVTSLDKSLNQQLSNLDSKLKNLDNYIGQQLSGMNSRISTFENGPTGVRSEFSGGNPNP
eukprot:3893583-Alexandrium_andersonii.AAC.1